MSKDKIVTLPDNINLLAYRFDSRSLEEIKKDGGFKDRRNFDEHIYQNNFSLDAGSRLEGELPLTSDNFSLIEDINHPLETFIPANAGAHSGGISVAMHPIGGMNAIGDKKKTYLHILSVGGKLVPVSSFYQTLEQLEKSIKIASEEKSKYEYIIESFTKTGEPVFSLTLEVGTRSDLRINVIVKKEKEKNIPTGFIVEKVTEKIFVEDEHGIIIGSLKENKIYDIQDRSEKGFYHSSENMSVIKKNLYEATLIKSNIKKHYTKKNIYLAFIDLALEKILEKNQLTTEQKNIFRTKYNCGKLANLINALPIIFKESFYQFEFNVIKDINVENIILTLKIEIISKNSFLVKSYQINENFSFTEKSKIIYDKTFYRIIEDLANNKVTIFEEKEINTPLIYNLITQFSASGHLDSRSALQDKQELEIKRQKIQTYFSSIESNIRGVKDIFSEKSGKIGKIIRNMIDVSASTKLNNSDNIVQLKNNPRRSSIPSGITEFFSNNLNNMTDKVFEFTSSNSRRTIREELRETSENRNENINSRRQSVDINENFQSLSLVPEGEILNLTNVSTPPSSPPVKPNLTRRKSLMGSLGFNY